MNTQTELTAIELFEQGLTKKDISAMAKNAITSVLEQGNVLQVAEALSAMETFIKEVKDTKEFKDYVRDEASKYPKGFIAASGAKIELAEVGVKYDYSQCGDPLYMSLQLDKALLESSIKERETFLKNLPEGGLETLIGDELVHLYKPSKSSTSSFKVTLAR